MNARKVSQPASQTTNIQKCDFVLNNNNELKSFNQKSKETGENAFSKHLSKEFGASDCLEKTDKEQQLVGDGIRAKPGSTSGLTLILLISELPALTPLSPWPPTLSALNSCARQPAAPSSVPGAKQPTFCTERLKTALEPVLSVHSLFFCLLHIMYVFLNSVFR